MPIAVQSPRRYGRLWVTSGLVALVAGALMGCGDPSTPVPTKLSKATIDAALASTPAGLTPAERRLERAANTLLPGDGSGALKELESTVASLRGKPVVVNLWGEWCVPCKKEIPVFQRATLALRGKVVFLGVATRTTRKATEAFLASDLVLPYPSIFDPDELVNDSVTGVKNIPKTFFYKPNGGKPFVHLGPYESVEKLQADIAEYAS